MAKTKKEKFIIDEKGEKQAVILDVKYYRRLLEDLADLRIIAERKDEEVISLEEVEDQLKKDGLL